MLTEQATDNIKIKLLMKISRFCDYLMAPLLLKLLHQTEFSKIIVELENQVDASLLFFKSRKCKQISIFRTVDITFIPKCSLLM